MSFVAYRITNNINGKRYIGITTQKPLNRWRHHIGCSRRGIGVAIKKYGEAAFSFEVIASAANIDNLLELERILIRQENSVAPHGYNLNAGGRGTLNASRETRRLIGDANARRVWSDDSRKKVSASLAGKKMSEFNRIKCRDRMKSTNPMRNISSRARLSTKALIRHQSGEWKAIIRQSNSTRTVTEATKLKIAAGLARYYAKKGAIHGR